MAKKKKIKLSDEIKLTPAEKKIKNLRKKRFSVMLERKKKLGIDNKCDRMDELFPPHLVNIDDPNAYDNITDETFSGSKLFADTGRKSKPLAFEKITTAVALLVKENPRVVIKAFKGMFKEFNPLIENIYYENFSVNRKIRILRKYVYHLAKYGLGYWREYIKKTYKKEYFTNDKGVLEARWIYDVFDEVAENVNPKKVVLDNNCIGVKDVNKPANDLYLFEFLSEDEFKYKFPEEVFENAKYVKENQPYMINPDSIDDEEENDGNNNDAESKKIMIITYENRAEGLREIWANEVPLESIPLPGGELSICGEKWVDDGDNYDGIGIGQIIEIYNPIVDDILNSSLERLRQIVRPNEDHFNNVENADEADDVAYGHGAVRKWIGSPENIKYSSPPPRTGSEQSEMLDLDDEIDRATMIPKNLSGTDDAKTAYQSAQNRESALNKLTIPLDAIKYTLEDTANLSIKLFEIIYQEPLETTILTPADSEFDEAIAILESEGLESERVTIMDKDADGNVKQIARRKFREFELPLKKEYDKENNKPTGRIVSSDEKEFWEMIPKTFHWKGRLEIVAESFLPVSKAVEDERKNNTINDLMNIDTTDEMGNPILKDGSGKPYMIDKVKLLKEKLKLNRDFEPDKIIVPLENQQQVAGNNENPLNANNKISLNNALGNTAPGKPSSLAK